MQVSGIHSLAFTASAELQEATGVSLATTVPPCLLPPAKSSQGPIIKEPRKSSPTNPINSISPFQTFSNNVKCSFTSTHNARQKRKDTWIVELSVPTVCRVAFASSAFIYPDSLHFHRHVLPSKLQNMFVRVKCNSQIVPIIHFPKYTSHLPSAV